MIKFVLLSKTFGRLSYLIRGEKTVRKRKGFNRKKSSLSGELLSCYTAASVGDRS